MIPVRFPDLLKFQFVRNVIQFRPLPVKQLAEAHVIRNIVFCVDQLCAGDYFICIHMITAITYEKGIIDMTLGQFRLLLRRRCIYGRTDGNAFSSPKGYISVLKKRAAAWFAMRFGGLGGSPQQAAL